MSLLKFQKKSVRIGVLLSALFFFYAVVEAEELRMLVWEGYAPPDQIEKFERYIKTKYRKSLHIKVSHVSAPNDFYNALRSKKADIISPSHNLIKDERFNYIKKGLLLPLELDNIPNYRHIIPAFQQAEYITENGEVYGVPFVQGPYGLAYNTRHLNAPDSWDVLWDPKYWGKYTISSDYYECNIYITALALGYNPAHLNNGDSFATPRFKNKLKLLARNAGSLWKGVDKADDLHGLSVAAAWGFSFPELKKRGELWKMAEPREGTMGWVDSFAIGYSLKRKPFLKKIAEEWLNFVLSPEYQIEVVVRGLGSDPVNTAIKDRLTPEENAKFHMDNPNYFRGNRILWPTLKRVRDRNRMKLLWEEALRQD